MPDSGRLQELVLKGSHREIGRQFGEACRGGIPEFIEALLVHDVASRGIPDLPPISRQSALERTWLFLPLFETFVPNIVEEVRGLAEGARISFEEALLLQIRGEIACIPDGGCTAFAVEPSMTASREVLIGQNVDMAFARNPSLIVHVIAPDAPALMMWTFPGLLGYHGINALGVAHFANQLVGPAWRMGLPHYPLKRRMLEQCSLHSVVKLLDQYPVCSSGNYVLADGQGQVLDVELTPEGYAAIEPPPGLFVAHTNHFLSEQFAPTERYLPQVPDSVSRLDQITAALEARRGHLTCEDMKAIMAGHAADAGGICCHGKHGLSTIASLIAEPRQGRLHVAAGAPCSTKYLTYTLAA